MKCPYCNNDMIPGYVQNGRRLVWDTEKLDGAYLPFTEKGRFVTKGFFKNTEMESYLCENCNILLSLLEE
ncbi:uncharacterized protein BN553_01928 [Firmicutes bacterium CAG:238]|jgi:hypothetical protein|nr:uncharacterized protein BN553_01928 [Firmicutes bacterium CAG:238]